MTSKIGRRSAPRTSSHAIILYDSVQRHASHAPFTRAFTHVVAHAFPNCSIHIYAHRSHLQAAFDQLDPVLDGRLVQKPLPENQSGHYASHVLRFLHETCKGPMPQPLIFLSIRPLDVWAAKLFRRWKPTFRCHMVLHGDLGSIRMPRSRHPLHRLSDLRGSLARANHQDVRLLALEPHIATALVDELPALASVVDAIHHPCLPDAVSWHGAPAAAPSTAAPRFGLVGIAGRAKGLDVFTRLARQIITDAPDAADFRLVGKLQPDIGEVDLSGISGPLPFTTEWLPRPVFEQELAALRYIVLPYHESYYAFSASGVLLDALRWRKPIVAFRTPPLQELTARFGNIGHLCDSEAEMLAILRELIGQRGCGTRYETQRSNLYAAHQSRLPAAVAAEYIAILHACWGSAYAIASGQTR